MSLVLKFMTKVEKFRALVPGSIDLQPLDLDRDWAELEASLRKEEWPFVRSDLELGEHQPGAKASHVARKDGKFAGFFTAFMFGHIGYLDMFVINSDFRGQGIARPLYFKVIESLQSLGATGLVCHTTNDSARLVKILGFTPGRPFTLRVRPPMPAPPGPALMKGDPDRFKKLDVDIFGIDRPAWTGFLASDSRVDLVGYGDAVAALRPRVENGYSLDHVLAPNSKDIVPLIDGIVARHGANGPLSAFAATGGPLEAILAERGFAVPDFFVPIGPLIEWREGKTEPVGRSELIHSLLWL